MATFAFTTRRFAFFSTAVAHPLSRNAKPSTAFAFYPKHFPFHSMHFAFPSMHFALCSKRFSLCSKRFSLSARHFPFPMAIKAIAQRGVAIPLTGVAFLLGRFCFCMEAITRPMAFIALTTVVVSSQLVYFTNVRSLINLYCGLAGP